MAKLFQQLLEPGCIATALKSNYYFLPPELNIESSDVILFMIQLQPPHLSIFSCQITDRLFASMKVNPDIYSHGRLLLLTQLVTVSLTTLGWRRLLHTIRRPRPPKRAQHAKKSKKSRIDPLFALRAQLRARAPAFPVF